VAVTFARPPSTRNKTGHDTVTVNSCNRWNRSLEVALKATRRRVAPRNSSAASRNACRESVLDIRASVSTPDITTIVSYQQAKFPGYWGMEVPSRVLHPMERDAWSCMPHASTGGLGGHISTFRSSPALTNCFQPISSAAALINYGRPGLFFMATPTAGLPAPSSKPFGRLHLANFPPGTRRSAVSRLTASLFDPMSASPTVSMGLGPIMSDLSGAL